MHNVLDSSGVHGDMVPVPLRGEERGLGGGRGRERDSWRDNLSTPGNSSHSPLIRMFSTYQSGRTEPGCPHLGQTYHFQYA